MVEVVIYTKSYDPNTKVCKQYLTDKGIKFDEHVIDHDPVIEQEMEEKSGGRTDVPQIFINGQPIGSFDDLKTLDATGKLDEMLNL